MGSPLPGLYIFLAVIGAFAFYGLLIVIGLCLEAAYRKFVPRLGRKNRFQCCVNKVYLTWPILEFFGALGCGMILLIAFCALLTNIIFYITS